MCDLAPFGTECVYEECEDKLILNSCTAFHLAQAVNNLYLSIPIVRHFVKPYRCPNFEIKRSDTE
jgi:hypothetical protein